MPIVLGGFAVFAVGALAIMLAIIAYGVLRFLSELLSRYNPLSFIFDIGEWLWNEITEPFVLWVVGRFESEFNAVSSWLSAHFGVLSSMSVMISKIARTAAEQLDIVRTQTIPTAQNSAETYTDERWHETAREAQNEAANVVQRVNNAPGRSDREYWIALAAVVSSPAVQYTAAIFEGVNAAEDSALASLAHAERRLESQVAAAENTAAAALAKQAEQLGTAIANLPTTAGANEAKVREIAKAEREAGEAASLYALNTVRVALEGLIPASAPGTASELREVQAHVERLIASAEAAASSALLSQIGILTSKLTAGEALSHGELVSAEGVLDKAIATAEGDARAELVRARSELEGLAKGGIGATPGELDGVRERLESSIAAGAAAATAAIGVLHGELDRALEGVSGDARKELERAQEELRGSVKAGEAEARRANREGLEGVYGDLTGKSAASAGDLSAVEGLLAGAISVPLDYAVEGVKDLEECAVRTCEGPNNFSELLKAALGVVDLGALGAFLAAAINEPANAEQTYASTVGGAYTDAEAGVNALLHGELLETLLDL